MLDSQHSKSGSFVLNILYPFNYLYLFVLGNGDIFMAWWMMLVLDFRGNKSFWIINFINKKKDFVKHKNLSLPQVTIFFMTLKLVTKKIKNTSYCMQVQKENFFSVLIFTYLGTDSGHQGTLLRKSQHESKTRNRKKLDSIDYLIKIAFNMYW